MTGTHGRVHDLCRAGILVEGCGGNEEANMLHALARFCMGIDPKGKLARFCSSPLGLHGTFCIHNWKLECMHSFVF